MTKKQCHRCLRDYYNDIKLLVHLKRSSCQILNEKYDKKYDERIKLLLSKENLNADVSKYIILMNDMIKCKCNLCNKIFANMKTIRGHILQSCEKYKHQINDELQKLIDNPPNPPIYLSKKSLKNKELTVTCTYCGKENIMVKDYSHHYKYECIEQIINETKSPIVMNAILDRLTKLENKHEESKQEIELIKNKPAQNNTIQIINVGDDCMNLLTKIYGEEKAFEYIKSYALGGLDGDCKLLKKLYLEGDEPSIYYVDSARNKLEYIIDENKNTEKDCKGNILRKLLAGNLQSGYLQGMNYWNKLNTDENNNIDLDFLSNPDVTTWKNHIYDLSNDKYQKKLFKNLDIPSNKRKTLSKKTLNIK